MVNDFLLGYGMPLAIPQCNINKHGGIRWNVHRIYGRVLYPLPGCISTDAGASFFVGSDRRTGRISAVIFLFGKSTGLKIGRVHLLAVIT